MQLEEIYQLYLQHSVVTTDSRNVPAGSLFFALKGGSFNGNAFAKSAIEKGAAYAFVDEEEFVDSERILFTDDVLKTLQQLANYHRKQFAGKVIGITGTNGKTTTKELIAAVLSKKYNTLCTTGNLNNHIGVPLTLLRLNATHEMAVIEMGANHCGEIEFLCNIAEPDFGIITNVGKAHLEGFGSFEGVMRTKGELYNSIRKNEGTIFINRDNEYLQEIATGIRRIEYGNTTGLFVSGQSRITSNPYLSMIWQSGDDEKKQYLETHLIGDYNLENILAAITIGNYFGVNTADINAAISDYIPQNNRSQLTKTATNTLIIDAYNANPTSMLASLLNFRAMGVSSKAVILGAMLELGDENEKEHQKIILFLEESRFEHVFLIGKEFSSLHNSFMSFPSTSDLIEYFKENPLSGQTILLKGSRGFKLEQLIDCL